jgi:exosome complex exonuclease RRP6
VQADKKYQMADWRIRPLPQEMVDYARADTHYLLYIYDNMRNELLENSNPETHNLLHASLDRSKNTCSQVFSFPVYDVENGLGPGGWAVMLKKQGKVFTKQKVDCSL